MNKSPASVLSTIAAENVLERLKILYIMYKKNIGDIFQGTHINVKILRHAVESYFLDLERMKNFHGITFADKHKRASFTMLWIVKAHPIQLHTDANITEALLVINEIFAIHAGLSHMEITISDISPGYIRNLIYILHFRQISPEILASAMYLLECSCKKKNP
jgi:hypothetical protein